MAEVTGDLGGQPIQLNNAATEATLKQLLAVMLSQATKGGKQNLKNEKELRQELDKLAKAAKATAAEHAKYRDKLKEAAKDAEGKKAKQETSKQFKELGREIQNFTRGIEASIKSIAQYASSLANMGNSVSNATSALGAIPVVGGVLAATLGAVAAQAEKQAKAFQQATAVGATFSGGITEMVNSASRMGLTFDQFTGIINRSGRDLALLGSGSADGAKQLVKYATAMRNSGLQDDLARLGYSAEDITESLAKYGAQLKTIGYSQAQIDATLVQSTGEYLKNLDAVSKVTGLNRKDLEKQRAERMRDSQFRAMMVGKDKETIDSMNGLMDVLGESQAKAFKEISATGTAMSDEAKALFTTAPQLAQAAMDAHNSLRTNGKYTMDQASKTHAMAQQEAKSRMGMLTQLGLFGDETQKRMAVGAMDVSAQTLAFGDAIKQTQADAKAASKNDPAALMRLQQQTAEISNKASLMLSDQFSKLTTVMQKFYEILNDYVIPTFEWAADNIGLTVGAMIGAKVGLELFKLGLTKMFGGLAGGGASSILMSTLKYAFSPAGLAAVVAVGAVASIWQLTKDFREGKEKQQNLRELDAKHKAGTLTPDEAKKRDELRAGGTTANEKEAHNQALRNAMTMGKAKTALEATHLTEDELKKEYGYGKKVLEEYVKQGGKVAINEIARGMGEGVTGFIEQGSTGYRGPESIVGTTAVGSNAYEEFEAIDTSVIEELNAAEKERLAILEADKSLRGRQKFAEAQRLAREAERAKEKARLDGTLIAQAKEEIAVNEKSGACKGYDFSSPEALFKSFRDKNMQPGATAATGSTAPGAVGTTGSYTGQISTGELGSMSAKYESGSAGSMAVGRDKSGGTSYGKYQIASKVGSMDDFLKLLKKNDPEAHARLMAAGPQDAGVEGKFAQEWKKLAGEGKIQKSEREFAVDKIFKPAMAGLKDQDLSKMIEGNKGLQEMMFSMAIQHGPGGAPAILNKVYKKGMTAEQLTEAAYTERGADGGKRYFGSSSENERAGVVNRFGREKQDVLALLGQPGAAPTVQRPAVTPTATAAVAAIAPQAAPVTPGSTTPNQPGTGAPGAGGATPANEIVSALERLNSMTEQIAEYNKDVAETSRQQLSAIKSIGKVY